MCKKITSEKLRTELLEFMINQQYPHDDLDSLAPRTRIEGVEEPEIASCAKHGIGEYRVKGSSSVDVEMEYGGGEDTVSRNRSFPFTFDLVVDEGGSIIKGETPVDTSSWDEEPEDE